MFVVLKQCSVHTYIRNWKCCLPAEGNQGTCKRSELERGQLQGLLHLYLPYIAAGPPDQLFVALKLFHPWGSWEETSQKDNS